MTCLSGTVCKLRLVLGLTSVNSHTHHANVSGRSTDRRSRWSNEVVDIWWVYLLSICLIIARPSFSLSPLMRMCLEVSVWEILDHVWDFVWEDIGNVQCLLAASRIHLVDDDGKYGFLRLANYSLFRNSILGFFSTLLAHRGLSLARSTENANSHCLRNLHQTNCANVFGILHGKTLETTVSIGSIEDTSSR